MGPGGRRRRCDIHRRYAVIISYDLLQPLTRVPGGTPSFSITKGFVQNPHNLVTECLLNVLCTMPTYAHAPQPKIVALSSIGLGPAGFSALPFALKPLYAMIAIPHKDKLGMERAIAHCAGWAWNAKADSEPDAHFMGEGWTTRKGLPASGTLEHALIVRAGLLTDGPCVADQIAKTGKGKPYRVSEQELGGYTISRKDAAHFVVDALTRRWDEFNSKRVNLTY